MSYLDAVAVPHGDPHGHGDRWDTEAEDLQQRGAEMFAELFGGLTGEAGAAPEGKATFRRSTEEFRWSSKNTRDKRSYEEVRSR